MDKVTPSTTPSEPATANPPHSLTPTSQISIPLQRPIPTSSLALASADAASMPLTDPILPLLTPDILGPSDLQEITFCVNHPFDDKDTQEEQKPDSIVFPTAYDLPQRLTVFSDWDNLEIHTTYTTSTH